jgi:glycosyltransferase involved in cell wall biosynthesis
MIVFISDYPREDNERDGMKQRVASIDSLFAPVPRTYLFISIRRNRRPKISSRGVVRIERVNLFWHYGYIRRCLERASCIYVHSVWNAMRAIPFLRRFRGKTIVDVHGVVPEEMLFVAKPIWTAVCQAVERVMVRNAHLLVVVTQKMADHFLKKYPRDVDPSRLVILPVLDSQNAEKRALRPRRNAGRLHLIYAGGVQKWQNIDLMLKTLQKLVNVRQDWCAAIYVPQEAVREVENKVTLLGCGRHVEVGSLTHDEVVTKYLTMDIGFVLREATLLNEVAMPTKLVEYITYGVVPVVLSPNIGDFVQHGYRYLTLRDLFDNRKVDHAALEIIRASNFRSLASIQASALEARRRIASYLTGITGTFSSAVEPCAGHRHHA